jgi:uncharacterized protein YdbL (DUF1318 family)
MVKQTYLRLFATLVLAFPLAAFALELDEAKANGLVGEDATGYLAAVADKPSADVAALVNDVNAKRRAEYQRIAQQNSLTLQQVEQIAAKKAIDKTPAGQYVRLPGEGWRRK